MKLVYSFLFCGTICLISEIIQSNTKLTPGTVTSIFVTIGTFLNINGLYDKIVEIVGGGASLPILSFGNLLEKGCIESGTLLGVFTGCLKYTSAGIASALFFSFIFTYVIKKKI